jgi:hypothetical protein
LILLRGMEIVSHSWRQLCRLLAKSCLSTPSWRHLRQYLFLAGATVGSVRFEFQRCASLCICLIGSQRWTVSSKQESFQTLLFRL